MVDGVDEADGREAGELKALFGEARWDQVVQWVQNVASEVLSDLSWEQIAALRDGIAATLDYEPPHTGSAAGTFGWAATAVGQAPPDKLAAAVQSTPPRISRGLEGWSRADIIAALALLLALIHFMSDRCEHLHPAPTPSQITQVFDFVTNVNQTFIPPPPPPAH